MAPAQRTLLLVDDEQAMLNVLTLALKDRFAILTASTASEAQACIASEHPDLVLLDLELPDMDGLLLIPKIRETSRVPIIVLSARSRQSDRVVSRKFGADDFIVKPFGLDDLDARIDAVLRRSTPDPSTVAPVTEWRAGSFSISNAHGASLDDVPFHLTPREFPLMRFLVAHAGEYVSRTELITAGWGAGDDPYRNLVAVHLNRLRTRLRRLPNAPSITYVHGKGYLLHARATLPAA